MPWRGSRSRNILLSDQSRGAWGGGACPEPTGRADTPTSCSNSSRRHGIIILLYILYYCITVRLLTGWGCECDAALLIVMIGSASLNSRGGFHSSSWVRTQAVTGWTTESQVPSRTRSRGTMRTCRALFTIQEKCTTFHLAAITPLSSSTSCYLDGSEEAVQDADS